jgi:hypothetical protein
MPEEEEEPLPSVKVTQKKIYMNITELIQLIQAH